jgi:hypothetical protein
LCLFNVGIERWRIKLSHGREVGEPAILIDDLGCELGEFGVVGLRVK